MDTMLTPVFGRNGRNYIALMSETDIAAHIFPFDSARGWGVRQRGYDSAAYREFATLREAVSFARHNVRTRCRNMLELMDRD